ncbi:hypothetical protein P3X46_017311 [Hevea brasiliensis]|uniref:EF-hand domain-containing protein n=1 Tax=Hevea brasiliensis TaxID=3981 RepID=A0ABQ9M1V5_HEVBR|nr:probable calcium-binding protein CML45 [Hevea brasiliensis]KAJ9174269.1 hypothetical protein P3X46_017311 [Hevea brasiliensis]
MEKMLINISYTVISSFHFYLQPLLKFLFPARTNQSFVPDKLSQEEFKIVMEQLGVFYDRDDELLHQDQRLLGADDLSRLFEEEEPSLEELKEAFDVFDENKDGFIDAKDLQRVLCRLGFKEGKQVEECKRMIHAVHGDDGFGIQFTDFLIFMNKCF